MSWLVKERPIKIIKYGHVDEDALRRAELSREDMLEAIRLEQVGDPADVGAAYVEGSGKVSVVPKRNR
ncbi:hypothetical protein LH128_26669 [Sphingomonas sp. LH128]|nr:hypothetical protein LH128_26669 [Sphingomonas sp. LH128]